jgi:hypothetical protein
MTQNSGFERIRKEAILASLKVLSWHLLGETEENHRRPQESRYYGRGWNWGLPIIGQKLSVCANQLGSANEEINED